MLKLEIMVYGIACSCVFLAEVVAWLGRRHGGLLLDKYLGCFFVSILLCALATIVRVLGGYQSAVAAVSALLLGMAGTYFLLTYMLFRGVRVFWGMFRPTSETSSGLRAIGSLTSKPAKAHIFIGALVLLTHAGFIYSTLRLLQLHE